MKALKKKWNSSRGATIFLALLFMLVCVMVGASVLAAAASNAGKSQINKDQQQDYYTVSSALNYVCGALKDVGYVGQYQYVREQEWQRTDPEDSSSPLIPAGPASHYFNQRKGMLEFSGSSVFNAASIGTALDPLRDGMDNIFAQYFGSDSGYIYYGDEDHTPEETGYTPNIDEGKDSWEWDFQVEVRTAAPLDEEDIAVSPVPDLSDLGADHFEKVDIHATLLKKDGSITLSAVNASGDYSMEARLKPDLSLDLGNVLRSDINIINKPDDSVFGNTYEYHLGVNISPTLTVSAPPTDAEGNTTPIKWTLDYIKKGTS